MDKIQIIAIIAVLFFIGLIARFIMKGKLRTEYSIIWILMGLMFLVFSIWRQSLDLLAKFFGVYYAPALIFIFLIHLSVVNSKQHEQIKKLAQEIALLKERFSDKNKS
jgi:hypothetical protein